MNNIDFFRILCVNRKNYERAILKMRKGKSIKDSTTLFDEGLGEFESTRKNLEKTLLEENTLTEHQKHVLENLRDFNDATLKNNNFNVQIVGTPI